jgi:hypothetical protein
VYDVVPSWTARARWHQKGLSAHNPQLLPYDMLFRYLHETQCQSNSPFHAYGEKGNSPGQNTWSKPYREVNGGTVLQRNTLISATVIQTVLHRAIAVNAVITVQISELHCGCTGLTDTMKKVMLMPI